MHPYLQYATEKQSEIIELIKRMAECESPSHSPADVTPFVDLVVSETRDIPEAKVIGSELYGNHLRLEFQLDGRKKEGQILGLGGAYRSAARSAGRCSRPDIKVEAVVPPATWIQMSIARRAAILAGQVIVNA